MSEITSESKILECTIAYNKYGAYCVPDSAVKRPAADLVKANSVYEPDTIDYLVKNNSGGSIVHAGTFFGDFLPALSKGIEQNRKIYAFEPNKESFRCTQITCLLNALDNVSLVYGGLGGSNSEGLIMTKNRKGISLGGASKFISHEPDQFKGQTESVSIYALDMIIPTDEHISILQLDVEGFEQLALEGASKLIDRCKPIIILENTPEDEWMNQNLYNKGYKFSHKLHHNKVYTV